MGKYSKAWGALLAGVLVAIPLLTAALSDNKVTLVEWLGILGAVIGSPVVVSLFPANKLDTGDIVEQAKKDPNIDVTVKTAV